MYLAHQVSDLDRTPHWGCLTSTWPPTQIRFAIINTYTNILLTLTISSDVVAVKYVHLAPHKVYIANN